MNKFISVAKEAEKSLMEKRFYTVTEIARYLGLSVSCIRKWVRTGQIPFSRFNGAIRFDIKKINEWANKHSRSFVYL